MFDLERFNGSFKGMIAECMFKLTNKLAVITRLFNRRKYFDIFGKYYNNEQIKFIEDNWYSIDAIEINFQDNKKNLILYEIKSKSAYYAKKMEWPFKMTENTYNMYMHAKDIGFCPKLAIVWFFKDWKFDVQIKDFEDAKLSIDKPKKYDKKQELAF